MKSKAFFDFSGAPSSSLRAVPRWLTNARAGRLLQTFKPRTVVDRARVQVCNTIPRMRLSNALLVTLLFAARLLVIQAQSSQFGRPEVMLEMRNIKDPKSRVQWVQESRLQSIPGVQALLH